MSDKKSDFKSKYKAVVKDAKAKFKASNKEALNSDAQEYILQIMATIGLEIESRFPSLTFENEGFKLFGRRKSIKSLSTKKKILTSEFKKALKKSLKSKSSNFPTEIRQLYDFYGYKFIGTHIEDTGSVLKKVITDILEDIKMVSPEDFFEIRNIAEIYSSDGHNYVTSKVIDLISEKFDDRYPGLKERFDEIKEYKKQSDETQQFLEESSSIDVSTLTYHDYYQAIISCYSLLSDLSYEESTEEKQAIEKKKDKAAKKLSKLESNGQATTLLPPEKQEEYNKKLSKLLTKIAAKRTNKLDLSVNSLIILDILSTSNQLKSLGVECSTDPSRTKKKRMPNGYISDFYSLDLPNGLKAELQVQSPYRFEYGEHGPAAHNKMENNIKKREFIDWPEDIEEYPNWEKEQFKSLPQYFLYKGNGQVYICSALDNFTKYFDCEDKEKVQVYVDYIIEHDKTNSLIPEFRSFTLDSPSVLPHRYTSEPER